MEQWIFVIIVKTLTALVMSVRLKPLRFSLSFQTSQHFQKIRGQGPCSGELFAGGSLPCCGPAPTGWLCRLSQAMGGSLPPRAWGTASTLVLL